VNDLEIVLIAVAVTAIFTGYLWLCDRVR